MYKLYSAGKTTWRSRDRRQYDSQSGSPELTDLIAKEARFLWTDRKRPSSEEKDRTSYGIDILPNEIRTNNGQRPKPVSGPGKDKNVNQETYNKIVEKVSKHVVPRKTSEDVFAERRRHLHDVCSQDPEAQQGGVKGIFKHQKSGVIYCFVPKAGCTFWKRVFHVVNQVILVLGFYVVNHIILVLGLYVVNHIILVLGLYVVNQVVLVLVLYVVNHIILVLGLYVVNHVILVLVLYVVNQVILVLGLYVVNHVILVLGLYVVNQVILVLVLHVVNQVILVLGLYVVNQVILVLGLYVVNHVILVLGLFVVNQVILVLGLDVVNHVILVLGLYVVDHVILL